MTRSPIERHADMCGYYSFFMGSLFFVGLLVAYDDPRLLGSGSLIDVSTSPFVIAANNAGIPAFGSFVNVVILLSVFSIGLSGVYGGSRTLCALAEQGYAPKIFAYIDRAGRPLFATIAIIAFGPLAYVSLASSGATVFDWLLALSGLAGKLSCLQKNMSVVEANTVRNSIVHLGFYLRGSHPIPCRLEIPGSHHG